MKTLELFYPEIRADIGNYSLKKGVEIEISSNKASYFDWARVKFTEQFQNKVSFAKNDTANIYLGYSGSYNLVFKGYVQKGYGQNSTDEIILKDDMLKLEETFITNTFLDSTPQEIIKYSLGKAGIQKMNITNKTYQSKAVTAVNKKSVINVINQVKTNWNMQEKFYFLDGTFYFGEKPEQSNIYNFQYGNNIITLEKTGGVWNLETVSVPFVKHSQKISVTHPKISGTFEVDKMIFKTKENGFIRTNIYFKEAA